VKSKKNGCVGLGKGRNVSLRRQAEGGKTGELEREAGESLWPPGGTNVVGLCGGRRGKSKKKGGVGWADARGKKKDVKCRGAGGEALPKYHKA